jgi:hypothetical protein
MRMLADEKNEELQRVLDELLLEDVDITVREVARRHKAFKNASAFTRSKDRMALIQQVQQRQTDARNVRAGPVHKRSESLANRLDEQLRRVAELEAQVNALVASHAACIRAVMLHGGVQAVEKFWADYRHIGDVIKSLGAGLEPAMVIPLGPAVVSSCNNPDDAT